MGQPEPRVLSACQAQLVSQVPLAFKARVVLLAKLVQLALPAPPACKVPLV
jgi:hypothetical protein